MFAPYCHQTPDSRVLHQLAGCMRVAVFFMLTGLLLQTLIVPLQAQQGEPLQKQPAEVSGNMTDGYVPPLSAIRLDAGSMDEVRVLVLNRSGQPLRLTQTMLFFEPRQLHGLEKLVGRRVSVVNSASAETARRPGDVIYYRAHFLHAALLLAQQLPGDQRVRRMPTEDPPPIGVDLQLVLGPPQP